MKSLLNPETVKWLKILIKVLIYALGLIATAYGIDAAAQALRW